ncbi:aminopeptidase [Paucibacter oligotrophus]|uniref:Aminopeptidase n=2 Tax=Roseateles oligotrophus TaxID=1769250 RepID=A0ABT2Y880_9BURK|nr:aminopeptidase [Roseateles oligotrophus]
MLALSALLGGCSQLGYLGQSVGGHLNLMAAARPVEAILAEPELAADLRERLLLSQRLRTYSVAQLKLPDNDSYRRYADLSRSAAVWNVVATPELSLTLKTWCFPVMGCVGYRGYFDRAEADAYAAQLRTEGMEVLVYGVPAYSTLGWSNFFGGDPLLNTFIKYPPGELAGMLFHELAHQVAYAADDTQFNESFATLVERRGAEAWLQAQALPAERAAHALRLQRREQFRALTGEYRRRLAELYATQQSDSVKRVAKTALLQGLRDDYGRLKAEEWGGDASYDGWFVRANNASFALLAAYSDLTPAFDALLARQAHDWPRFYAEVKRLAALPKAERRAELLNNKTGD